MQTIVRNYLTYYPLKTYFVKIDRTHNILRLLRKFRTIKNREFDEREGILGGLPKGVRYVSGCPRTFGHR